LHTDRWMLSSFTMNDFYLATMMLCLSVSIWKKANPGKIVNDDEKVRARVDLLANAYVVCEESSATSTEAKRITGVLSTILGEYVHSPSRYNGDGRPPERASSSEAYMERRDMFRIQPSAFFPNSYDFNLAPLSLSDTQPADTGHAPRQSRNSAVNGSYFDSFPYVQNENQGQEQADSIAPNPFAPFLPFNPSYGFSPAPTSDALTSSTSEGLTASVPAMQHPPPGGPSSVVNMDIDWAFLDQWMAVPDTEFIHAAPTNANTLPRADTVSNVPTSGPFHEDWTSTPIRFLGTNILQQSEHSIQESNQTQGTGFRSQPDVEHSNIH
jgi:hypothetical protein